MKDGATAREVYRDDLVVAFFPLEPATLGHTLVVPREHVPYIWDVDDETASQLMRATVRVARAVRSAMRPDGMNVIQSNGEAATQTVMHVHVHVVPRYRRDEVGLSWPRGARYSDDEVDSACSAIRAVVAG